MRIFALTISLTFTTLSIFAQGLGENRCDSIEALIKSEHYREALRLYLLCGETCCSEELRARVLKLNGRYREAVDLLAGIESEEADLLRKELDVILGKADDETAYSVRAHQKNDTVASSLIFFVDEKPVPLIERVRHPDQFPYREENKSTYFPDTSVEVSNTYAAKHLENFERRIRRYNLEPGSGTMGPQGTFYYTARYFSPVVSGGYSKKISIYQADSTGKHRMPDWIDNRYTYAHPAISKDGWLYFASDIPGGEGGMDLWKVNVDGPRHLPINLGKAVNSPFDELFPCPAGDSLYFVSNDPQKVIGGYDILLHYNGATNNPGAPLNGSYDDFNPYAKGSELRYMVSNRRAPVSSDEIFEVEPFKARQLFDLLHGNIETSESTVGQKVELLDDEGSVVDYTYTDRNGAFTFPHIKGGESYEVHFPDTELAAGDRLFLFDSNYQILEEIESDGSGGFKFVLLSPEDYALEKQVNRDESMLSLDISGMFAQSGRSNLGGVEIVLQDASGETIAKAFTNSQGHFSFEQVRPDEAYRIKSNVVDPNSEIRIFNDRGEVLEVIKPDPEGAYVYVRLKDTDRVITITNEKNIKIKVEEDEKFNLPHIYFASDRAVLTDEGIAVLERLRKILDENLHVSIDLAGHTDSRGALEYNLMLSEMRIESVKTYLVEHGVSSSRITGKGYGELQPVNHCVDGVECTEEEHAANRRTEIRFYSANKP